MVTDIMGDTKGPLVRQLYLPEPAFGNWLAGLIDGEGCFSILKRVRKDGYTAGYFCRFSLQLRLDDRAILDEISSRTGIGLCSTRDDKCRKNPLYCWETRNKLECNHLCNVLNLYPLRAKKKRDYEIWRCAVEEWCAIKPLYHQYKNKDTGTFLPRRPRADWSKIAQYKQDLTASKLYNMV